MKVADRWLVALCLLGAVIGGAGVVYALNQDTCADINGGVPLSAPDGMTVTVDGSTCADLRDFTVLTGTVDVTTDAGNATFFSSGEANATVDVSNITGTFTTVTAVDASPNTIQIEPEDKPAVTVGGGLDSIAFRATYGVDDSTRDFSYSASGTDGRVTIQGVPADQDIVAVDQSTGNFLDAATSDSSGSITYDTLNTGSHDVLLQSSLADPVLTNPTPTGGQSTEPTTIAIDVSDADFDNGDSVDVEIELDGTLIHSETITANQTVSTSMPASGQTGGEHEWTVTATPDYGDPTTEQYEYSVPDTLTIRNETNHSDIIDSPIESVVTFFGEDTIITRNTTDGTIRMTGLPVSQEFIAEVEPSDANLTSRALWLDSIYQQQSIYLLNTSAYPTIDARFVLDDPTAEYDSNSILFIQRPINTSTETVWQTVHSDRFGSEGVTATLEEGQRYRIRVRNEEGDTQIIGPYRADISETVNVVPGSPTIEVGDFRNGWAANAEISNTTLEYRYDDPTNSTDKLTVWIHEQGDPTNRLVANATYFDVGTASATHSLTANESDKTWVVNFLAERNNTEFTHSITVSNRRGLFGVIGPNWRLMIGIGSLLMFAGAFSILNARVGAVVVALVGGLWWWIGLLPGATMGFAVVLALFLAGLNWMRKGGSPA